MSLGARLRNNFIAGLLLVAPLAVTLFVLQFVFRQVTGVLNPVVTATRLTNYTANIQLVAQLLAAVLLAVLITLIGFVASRSVGQRLFGSFERGVRLVPLVRTVYFGVRQVSESLTEGAEAYERVVLVEYPRPGTYMIGFVTNEAPRSVARTVDGALYSVFLPHSPNPTVGKLLMVSETEMRELDMSVRRGLRLVVTTGLSVEPDDIEELPEGVAR